jgi:soluble lytic murein transglycosylase-like protein
MRLGKRSLIKRDYLAFVAGLLVALLVVGVILLIKNSQTPLKPESPNVTISWLPSTVKKWNPTVQDMAQKYDVDPNLVAILLTMESGGYAKAKSEAGAQGLMQITPLTAKDIASKYLKEPVNHYNLMDPKTNIEFGTAYIAFLRDYFSDVDKGPDSISLVELIGAGYNGGPGTAQALHDGEGLKDTQTVIYSRDAFNMWRERHSKSSPTFDRWKERGGIILINKASGH